MNNFAALVAALARRSARRTSLAILTGFISLSLSLTAAAAPAKEDAKATRMSVTIYEMRSSVTEIPARAATDMFTTALVKTRKFRVVERQRIGEGVARERDLNAQGITTGKAATKQVRGAGVIFEATISEVTVGKTSNENGFAIGGMQLGGSSASDGLGIDVRVLDASTGEVLDAVNVRKAIKSSGSSVAGVGALVDNVLALKGKSTRGFTPDVASKSSAREGVDEVLRDLIEEAVKQLTAHSGDWDIEP
jgi:curli biogenesis system outer membrane secretion channel CsgG